MPFDTTQSRYQLLTFTVPGLPEVMLAVALAEVLEIADFGMLTPVPFAPPAVLGLGEWRDHIVTMLDLSRLLGGTTPELSGTSVWRYLVAQVILNNQLDYVAWPILPGAGTRPVPAQVPEARLTFPLPPLWVRAAILLDDQPLVLLNLEALATHLSIP